MTNKFIKHWRLASLVLGIIVLLWVLYLLRTMVLPFAIGLILAYLLMPLVWWLESKLPPKNKWPSFRRVLSVLITFVLLLALIGGFAYFIVTAVIDATLVLLDNTPEILSRGLYHVQSWIEVIHEQLPPEISQEMDKTLIQGGATVGSYIRDAVMGAISDIPSTFTFIIGFAVLPFFLFYILKDSEKLKKSLVSAFPPRTSEHLRNIVVIVERVLGRYIRAQIMLGLIVAYFSFIGLLILKIPFAPALAILAGATEVIPTLGPWIGGAVAVMVTLAMAPEKAIWVVVLFVVVQLVENNLLVPKIQSAYLRIHPAIMIVLLVLGAYIAGIWGLVVIGPLVATLVEIFKYVRQHYDMESCGGTADQDSLSA